MSAPAPAARILRGYGPLLAFAVLFCLMAAFVPTVGDEVRTVPAEAAPGGESRPGGDPAGDEVGGAQAGELGQRGDLQGADLASHLWGAAARRSPPP